MTRFFFLTRSVPFFALLVVLISCQKSPSDAATYYVSTHKGDDNRNATEAVQTATPWKTISKAIGAAQPGDTIVVGAGTYDEGLTIKKTRLTIRNQAGARPLLRPTNKNLWEMVSIDGASYIEFRGFELDGKEAHPQTAAITIKSASHHIKIIDNIVHDSGGGGIGTYNPNVNTKNLDSPKGGCDYITIENNTIYNTCFRSIYDPSAISLHGDTRFDDKPGYHSIIRNNRAYGNIAKYPPPGAFSSKHTDGNGIILDLLGKDSPPVLIENNIIYNNGGRGIHIFKSANTTVVNNICYNNAQDPDIGQGELTCGDSSNVIFANNIAYGHGKGKVINIWGQNPGVIFHSNLIFNGDGSVTDVASLGTNNIYANPLFVNPQQGDFRSANGSLAVNSGTAQWFAKFDFSGRSRPLGRVDRGAYERW